MGSCLLIEDKKVSCVMITGHIPERRKYAEVAIQSYLNQTYKNTELVIINQDKPFYTKNEVLVDKGMSIGKLRNIGLENSSGDLIIQWDDDDYYHPERIKTQVEEYNRRKVEGYSAVVLHNIIIHDLTSGVSVRRRASWRLKCFPGTILHEKTDVVYSDLRTEEDTDFLCKLKFFVMNNDPLLYTRMYHGYNACSRSHFDDLLKEGQSLDEYQQQYIENILKLYR